MNMISYDDVEKLADKIGKRVIVDGDYEWMAESTIDEEFGQCDYSSTITVTHVPTDEKVLLIANQHLDARWEYDPDEDEEVYFDADFDFDDVLSSGDEYYQGWLIANQIKDYMTAVVLGDQSVFLVINFDSLKPVGSDGVVSHD